MASVLFTLPVCKDVSVLAREPTYRLNCVGFSWQPTKLSVYAGSRADCLHPYLCATSLKYTPGAAQHVYRRAPSYAPCWITHLILSLLLLLGRGT